MQQLTLKIMRLDPIEIGDANRAHARRRKIQGGRAAESACADDEHARRREPALAFDAHFVKQQVPAVTSQFGGRKAGQGIGHPRERERIRPTPQMKLRSRAGAARIAPMRCLGIDYGARRIGLSYGDQLGVATPLPAITEADPVARFAALEAMVAQRRITDIVIGHPLNMDDSVGPKAREVEAFAVRLREHFGLPVHLIDERLTSYEAESTIAKTKRRALRGSGIIDSRAATLILQDFLNLRFPPAFE